MIYLLALFPLIQTPDLSSPEATIRSFESAFGKCDFKTAVACVEGGVYSEPVQRFEKILKEAKRPPMFQVREIASEVQNDTATVRIQVRFVNSAVSADSLAMRRADGMWRIVPNPDPAEFKREKTERMVSVMVLAFAQPMVMEGIVAPIEKQAPHAKAMTAELMNMKAVGLATFFYMSDHDDVFPKSTVSEIQALKPYLKKSPELLQRFRLQAGVRWRINPALRGKSATAIEFPERTPMVYEEFKGALGFRYGGKALVAMADSSVRYFTREEAKKLLWNPWR